MFNRKLWLPLIIGVVCAVQVSTARAQRVVKKLTSECPMGYIDTANGKCSALGLMTYTLRPRWVMTVRQAGSALAVIIAAGTD